MKTLLHYNLHNDIHENFRVSVRLFLQTFNKLDMIHMHKYYLKNNFVLGTQHYRSLHEILHKSLQGHNKSRNNTFMRALQPKAFKPFTI